MLAVVVVVVAPPVVEDVPPVGEVEVTGGGDPAGGNVITDGPVGTTGGSAVFSLEPGHIVVNAMPTLVTSARATGTAVRSGRPPTWTSQNPFDRG
ncbi:hypothetical protein [Kutzneria kofuensis]|uniref:hypothetical protein n=1 Tax=Kutzneria kofuensis TaxID=103725 RepID=UPI0031E55642